MRCSSSDCVLQVVGYGMAVAKAQHAIADIVSLLRSKGIQTRFAIHPVAGRYIPHIRGRDHPLTARSSLGCPDSATSCSQRPQFPTIVST